MLNFFFLIWGIFYLFINYLGISHPSCDCAWLPVFPCPPLPRSILPLEKGKRKPILCIYTLTAHVQIPSSQSPQGRWVSLCLHLYEKPSAWGGVRPAFPHPHTSTWTSVVVTWAADINTVPDCRCWPFKVFVSLKTIGLEKVRLFYIVISILIYDLGDKQGEVIEVET